ncbi:ABC transporter substrate-binding protein [Paenibacillus oceani]|uniref:Carbohydrate ABC transporter substrate-binding protein n=1 Tax=Paenibacillus oceani TaxID=2772510 RepID=A0A927CDB7_9BACL|nr:ABC transporter substrate-binding protein [Paenibacillus oceani]MBD2865979.1 carbohydrate ABC transporter substrate-binding protein [Paenibacillus oceani]
MIKQCSKLIALTLLAQSLAACSSGEDVSTELEQQPVELTLYAQMPLSDEQWQTLMLDPLRKKYPHITLHIVNRQGSAGPHMPDLIASGDTPDLYTVASVLLGEYAQLGVTEDFTPYAKRLGVDVNRFKPQVMEALRALAPADEVYALPYNLNFNAIYYNRDIFDLFGVDYPVDGMTWKEVMDKGREVSRHEGGRTYRGLDPNHVFQLAYQRSVLPVDAATKRASVNTPVWQDVFRLAQEIYSIPNNEPANFNDVNSGGHNRFMKDRNVAMYAGVNLAPLLKEPTETGLNWDVVQFPSTADKPNVYSTVDAHVIGMTSTTKHKEDAARVIELFTSNEVQKIAVRQIANFSPLSDSVFQEQFGADVHYLKGKNFSGVFRSVNAETPAFSVYNVDAERIIRTHYRNFLRGDYDVNTALRTAEEEVNQRIEALSQQ